MHDKKFQEMHLKDIKRQNQILKQAISRLQLEFGKLKEKAGDTFLTEADQNKEQKGMTIEQILDKLKSGDLEVVQGLGITFELYFNCIDNSFATSDNDTHKVSKEQSLSTSLIQSSKKY